MATSLEENSGESQEAAAAGGDGQRNLPTPFLKKTYELIEDSEIDDIISWNEKGTSFILWDPEKFACVLLPKYFRHNNISSFIRQLNLYGFRKVPDRWEFAHDNFRRGEPSLLLYIHRRKNCRSTTTSTSHPATQVAATGSENLVASPRPTNQSSANSVNGQVISTNSSQATPTLVTQHFSPDPELVAENERLRRKNSELRFELDRLHGICKGIMNLMANYNPGTSNTSKGRPLDTVMLESDTDAERESRSPRLFGVPLGGKKRARGSDDVQLRL